MTSTLPKRLGEVWTHRDGDQTAILDPATGTLYRLNPSAVAVWELCDGETGQDEIIDALSELTGRSRTVIGTEVESVLNRLSELGLVN